MLASVKITKYVEKYFKFSLIYLKLKSLISQFFNEIQNTTSIRVYTLNPIVRSKRSHIKRNTVNFCISNLSKYIFLKHICLLIFKEVLLPDITQWTNIFCKMYYERLDIQTLHVYCKILHV